MRKIREEVNKQGNKKESKEVKQASDLQGASIKNNPLEKNAVFQP